MEKTMTVKDAIQITIDNLGQIAVPRSLNQLIGIPIDQAIANLQQCIDAINRAEQQNAERAAEPDTQEAADGND